MLLNACALGQLQEIKRPTADSDPGQVSYLSACFSNSGNQSSPSMSLAYDSAGLATFSSMTTGFNTWKGRLFIGWGSTTQTYTNLTLNVNSATPVNDGNQQAALITYSLDAGNTWTTIRTVNGNGKGWSQITDTVTLSTSQDLTLVRVAVCAAFLNTTLSVWDIWTVGTYNGPAGGTGSTSGNAARGVVTPN